MRTTTLFGCVLLPSLLACGALPDASDEPALGSAASAVQGGKTDTRRSDNFAVGIASRLGAICSGTLIAPNLVLTARHCVVPPEEKTAVTCADTFPKSVTPSTLFVTTEPMMRSARKMYVAAEITTPGDASFCGNDIALIRLRDNIPSTEAVPATPVVQFAMTDSSKLGDEITAVGYGITSPNATDSGVRRIRQGIKILCVPGDDTTDCAKYESVVDGEREFVTEGFVCSGDSGSGAFDQDSFTSGKPYVLGALSRGPQTDERCLAAIYSRTDAHADMIIAAGKKAAKAGGYEPAEWVVPPAPASEDPSVTAVCEEEPCAADDALEEPVTVTRTTTTGCSAAPGRSSGALGALALGAALALTVARRRRAG